MDVIDTSVMPGDDMDPDAIDAAASTIASSGSSVSTTATSTHTAWAAISGAYEAPEQGQLYAAMNPVKSEAEVFKSDLASAATALTTFAETVRTIKAAVVKIRADVSTFENKIASDGTIQPAGGYNPYAGGYKLRIQWNEDTGMVAEQHALAGRINAQVDALRAAEIACANSIDDVTGAAHVPTSGPGAPPAPPHVADAQWYLTAPIDRPEDCGQRIAHGVVIDWFGGAVAGGLSFVGVDFDTTTGKFGNFFTTLGNSWGGLAKLTVGSSPVLSGLLSAMGAGKYVEDSQKTFWGFLNDQIARDPFAKDPWHRWKEDPLRAGSYTAVNLITWIVPPVKALTAAKIGKVGELAGDAAKAGDLAKAGQATRFGSAADLVKALRESGSLKSLTTLSDALKAKLGGTAGKASDLSHLGDELTTPKLSEYDLSAQHGAPHPEVPVRDGGPGAHHQPAEQPAGHGSDAHPTQHPDHTPGHTDHAGDGQTAHDPLAVKVKEPDHAVDPGMATTYADDVARRKGIVAEHRVHLGERNTLAKELGVKTKDLTVAKARRTLDDLLDEHPEKADRIDALRAATAEEQRSFRNLVRSSEDLGMDASRSFVESQPHGEVIVGGEHGRGSPHELDTIGLKREIGTDGKPHTTLVVAEAKGGSARLGFRTVDGVRVQQGTTAYLRDLLRTDARFRTYLAENGDFARQLAEGRVGVEYKLVRARPSGTIGVSDFQIRQADLGLDQLRQPVSPGR